MWILIVTMIYWQRGPLPNLQFQEFNNQKECVQAANWTAAAFKESVAALPGNHGDVLELRVQCVKK